MTPVPRPRNLDSFGNKMDKVAPSASSTLRTSRPCAEISTQRNSLRCSKFTSKRCLGQRRSCRQVHRRLHHGAVGHPSLEGPEAPRLRLIRSTCDLRCGANDALRNELTMHADVHDREYGHTSTLELPSLVMPSTSRRAWRP